MIGELISDGIFAGCVAYPIPAGLKIDRLVIEEVDGAPTIIGPVLISYDPVQLNGECGNANRDQLAAWKGAVVHAGVTTGEADPASLKRALDEVPAVDKDVLVHEGPVSNDFHDSAPVVVRTNTVAGRGEVASLSPEGSA